MPPEPTLKLVGALEIETVEIAAAVAARACRPNYFGQKALSRLLPNFLFELQMSIEGAVERYKGFEDYRKLAIQVLHEYSILPDDPEQSDNQELVLIGEPANVAIKALKKLSETKHNKVAQIATDDTADKTIEAANIIYPEIALILIRAELSKYD